MHDFFFAFDQLELGTPLSKFQKNLAAIRLARTCADENRPATPEEQAVLACYSGWGDAAVLRYLGESAELQTLLSAEELRAARGSSLNAHYTALPVVDAIWSGLIHLGLGNLPNLRVLDPSAGVGHFKSRIPAVLRSNADAQRSDLAAFEAQWVEIELDLITARILRLLHPGSKIYAEGFESVDLPDAWFDLVISNVPFGNYGVVSRRVPAFARGSVHDFFFANSLAPLRPGGILAFLTSRYTLDKKDPALRNYLARHLDLLAAVRLPETAFHANAGTTVVTDLLIFQKRAQESLRAAEWAELKPLALRGRYGSSTVAVNAYYVDHPQCVLGTQALSGSMYRGDGYTVEPDQRALGATLAETLQQLLPANLITALTPAPAPDPGPVILTTASSTSSSEANKRLALLHAIFSAAKTLLAAEVQGTSLFDTSALRHRLNQEYERFTSLYGPIHQPANARLLEDSVEGPFLLALENYDRLSGTAKKSGLFSAPLVRSRLPRVDDLSVQDALLLSLDQKGGVDLAFIASVSQRSPAQVGCELGDLIFQTPGADTWQTADAYLSGNVRAKLRAARAAAALDPALLRNVQALEAVLPEDLQPSDIRAPLGAGWIPVEDVQAFLSSLLSTGTFSVTYAPALAHWQVDCFDAYRIPNGLNYSRWGTARISALELVDHGLNARSPQVWDAVMVNGQEVRSLNQVETVAAQHKLAEIKAEFERWLWCDPARAARLAEIYNERYNAYRVRAYDGSHLTLPGLNLAIHPRPHQLDVVWRALQSKSLLVAHQVGMGKTLAAIVSVMESKRLGLTHKAMLVVPNHLTSQWHAQALWAYPGANILVPSSADLAKAKRGTFLSRVAANAWDMVIVPFSSFKLLPVQAETLADFFQAEINRLELYLWELKAGDSSARATKEVEKALKRFRVKLAGVSEMAKDSSRTITWEELGVDLLVVDEFNHYKNLFFATKMTRIAGLNNTDSQRAFDMFVKLRWLLAHGGKVIGMTGTPITNSIAEMYTMQRFFQMEVLEDLGLAHFDAWANQFALAEPGLEMTPDGAGFRMNTRFRKFVNVPELMKIWSQVVDTRRIDPESGIDRPGLYAGGPLEVVTAGSLDLKGYTDQLALRAERVRCGSVDPHTDNILKISSDGRKAALDMSLVAPAMPGAAMPKIDALVELVAQLYHASTPVRGTQAIFCDLATPKPKV